MMLIIDDGDVVDKSPWPWCGNWKYDLCRRPSFSPTRQAGLKNRRWWRGRKLLRQANIFYRDILPYLPKTCYWVTDLHESWRIWLFLLCSFQSNIEGAQGGCIWTWVPLNYIMEHCDFLVLEGIMGRGIESCLNIDLTNYVWIESYSNYVWIK